MPILQPNGHYRVQVRVAGLAVCRSSLAPIEAARIRFEG